MGEEVEETKAALNTDRELWREPTDRIGAEFYQPSIHVTESGGIGINVGGSVYVRPLAEWHAAMRLLDRVENAADNITHYAYGRTADEQVGEAARHVLTDIKSARERRLSRDISTGDKP